MKNKEIVIFGTGEIAELALFYFTHDSEYRVVAFTADDDLIEAESFHSLPLIPLSQICQKYPPKIYEAHVALSYRELNRIRDVKYHEMKSLGYKLVSYISSKSISWSDLSMGDNCFILENQTIQPTVKIGSNVMIWSGNHLGHGCEIGDHTYISSHVCISGHAQIGTHCFFGVNAAIKDFAKIGNSVFVAMGANVTQDAPDGSVVLAPKSEVYKADTKMAKALKRKYFKIKTV
jgi:sugar O-acyltransferase (sialic acid O-acetyltransferase NeuD family)